MSNSKEEILSKFMIEFQEETDRGAAILAASLLDEKLKNILYHFLIDCKQTKKLLDGYSAPLGTFSSRLNMAYALGIISEYEFEDCNTIRKIRNDFAHKFELEFSFEAKRIKSLCWELNAPTPGEKESFKNNPRMLFTNGVAVLYATWLYREERVDQKRLTRPDWHYETWNKE